jgi:hypothetical protein
MLVKGGWASRECGAALECQVKRAVPLVEGASTTDIIRKVIEGLGNFRRRGSIKGHRGVEKN